MKLLLDQGLPRMAAALLTHAGFETTHVGEIGYATADDEDILALGEREGYVVVTLDADFHSLLALQGASKPSVIRIRIEGLKAKPFAELLQTVLARCAPELEQGAVVTVQEGRIRIRELPLVSGR